MTKLKKASPWLDRARRYRAAVSGLSYGERESGLRQLAPKGGNTQTLRRSVAALEFAERVKAESNYPAERLLKFPLAAVEYLARWHKRDAAAAFAAADKFAVGQLTVKELELAEKASRGLFSTSGKALETDFKVSAVHFVKGIVKGDLNDASLIAPVEDRRDPRSHLDFLFESKHQSVLAGALIVGPYRDNTLYERRAFEWVAKAAALLRCFNRIYLILPGNSSTFIFDHWKSKLNCSDRELIIRRIEIGREP